MPTQAAVSAIEAFADFGSFATFPWLCVCSATIWQPIATMGEKSVLLDSLMTTTCDASRHW